MTKKDLFEYLDQYSFVGTFEINMATEDFFRKKVEKNSEWCPSIGELAYIGELAEEYKKDRNITWEYEETF